jgi:outer membrane protein
MKKFAIVFSFLTVLAVLVPSIAFADNIRIAVIDMRQVIANSPQAKAVMDKLKQEFKTREDQILAVDKSLKEKSEKMQRNGAVMSEAEKSKLEREIMGAQRDLQRMQGEFREDATIRQQEEMKKLVDNINKIVQDIAKKENYDLVVHAEAASFVSQKINLTDKVVAAVKSSG